MSAAFVFTLLLIAGAAALTVGAVTVFVALLVGRPAAAPAPTVTVEG